MIEILTKPVVPVNFETQELQVRKDTLLVYIGNTGGKYTWQPDWNYFGQHFTPDYCIDNPGNPDLQRKFVTLYPAVLWHFIHWLSNLPDDDPKKGIQLIQGYTNPDMSHFRAKLLGDVYCAIYLPPEDNSIGDPIYTYQIDINRLRAHLPLMARLKRFSQKATAANYTTTYTVETAKS